MDWCLLWDYFSNTTGNGEPLEAPGFRQAGGSFGGLNGAQMAYKSMKNRDILDIAV